MKLLDRAEKAIFQAEVVLALIAGISVLAMMVAVTIDVVLRNVFKVQILGVYELTQNVFMPMVVIPAMGYTYHIGVLPKFDLLRNKLGARMETFFSLSVSLVEILVFWLLAYYSFFSAHLAWIDRRSVLAGGGAISTYYVYLFLPISFSIMFLDSLLAGVKKLFPKKPDPQKTTPA